MNTSGKLVAFWPTKEEWPILQKMDSDYFPRPWSLAQWESLTESHHRLYLWKQNQEVLGFALFSYLPGDEAAHLFKICLHPNWRGGGRAESFWQKILEDFKHLSIQQVYLEVEESNVRAQHFYKKVGFKAIRTVKGYYSDGENGIMMLFAQ